MGEVREGDRIAILAMIDQALRDAERTDPPPEAERGAWLQGDVEWSEPDMHGWIERTPTRPDIWVPKALAGWRIAFRSGYIMPGLLDHPDHALARWPEIEAAVQGCAT